MQASRQCSPSFLRGCLTGAGAGGVPVDLPVPLLEPLLAAYRAGLRVRGAGWAGAAARGFVVAHWRLGNNGLLPM